MSRARTYGSLAQRRQRAAAAQFKRLALGVVVGSLMSACAAFVVVVVAPVNLAFQLEHVDAAGELWILDYGMSRDDCVKRLAEAPAGRGMACRVQWD